MSVPRFIGIKFLGAQHVTMYQLNDVKLFRRPTYKELRAHPGAKCMIEFYSVNGLHPLETAFEDIEDFIFDLIEEEVNGTHSVV